MKLLLSVCIALLAVMPKPGSGQARDSSRGPVKPAVLSGIVKDEYGDPLPKAEILVQPDGYSAQADTSGKFRIEAPTGEYNVVFRRLGYAAEDFSWRARAGEGVEMSIRLNPVPRALDTVVVLDKHNRAAGASFISGFVVDSAMKPLKDVELRLIGTGRHATSYESGRFFFTGIADGSYVLRARRMGFSPVNHTVRVGKGEEHAIAMKLTALPHTLPTVEVRERSGFGHTAAIAWEEFDHRQRWQSSSNVTVNRDEFGRLGKMPLDLALRATPAALLIPRPSSGSFRVPAMILGARRLPPPPPVPDEVCVLLNGIQPMRLPLSFFKADEVERVEVFAPGSDWTGTIGARMVLVKRCEPNGFMHPSYFVVWLRGGS